MPQERGAAPATAFPDDTSVRARHEAAGAAKVARHRRRDAREPSGSRVSEPPRPLPTRSP